jgi:vacuolar-type H+-ATPase subunit I/STV1
MLPGHPRQTTLFVEIAKDVCFGAGAAWKARDGWKSKAMPLGKHLTEVDAASFAISTVLKDLPAILSRTDHRRAEIVTRSRLVLTEIQDPHPWAQQTIIDVRRRAKQVEEAGGAVTLTWLSSSASSNGSKAASTVAQRAAKQPPKAMRSASLSYVKQAIREKWKPMEALDKHVEDARKSVASRYLQLKSGHAITGTHLLRIGKVQDARCWWCSSSRQTVEHLLLECRKWRRERATMIRKLSTKNITIRETPDRRNARILFEHKATVDVLEFIETTEVGKRPVTESDEADSWDIERLDRGGNEEGEVKGNEWE